MKINVFFFSSLTADYRECYRECCILNTVKAPEHENTALKRRKDPREKDKVTWQLYALRFAVALQDK